MLTQTAQAEFLPVDKLIPFQNHPFQVKDNDEMDQLVWSILTQGLLTPIVVRPAENGCYEIISGHRRVHACRKAGLEKIPALVYAMDRDAAAIALVDSNLHRDDILPSEKAHAYKMKMEAMTHQGASRQPGEKWSITQLSEKAGESERQIHRYIRLTNLEPELLALVDQGKIALTPAVELSYLKPGEQRDLLAAMEMADCTPSYSQAVQLRKISQLRKLSAAMIESVMAEPKANQKEKISFRMDDLRQYFPKSYSAARIQETILKLLGDYQKKRQREQMR